MLKKPVTYTNFNDEVVTKVLYFHISKTRLSENISLTDRLNAVQDLIAGPERQLAPEEVSEILDLMKLILKLSYGIRSADGESFDQSDEIWDNFTKTAAYDALLFQLFQDEGGILEFLTGVMPKDLRPGPQDHLAKAVNVIDTPSAYLQPKQDLDAGEPRAVEGPTVESLEAQIAALKARHGE